MPPEVTNTPDQPDTSDQPTEEENSQDQVDQATTGVVHKTSGTYILE